MNTPNLISLMMLFLLICIRGPIYSQDASRCLNTPLYSIFRADHEPLSKSEFKAIGDCISIYAETDLYTVDQLGGRDEAEAWINRLFSQSALLYAQEGISIFLSSVFIPETAQDDWSAPLSSTADILNGFGEIRQDGPSGRLKHFVTMRALGGGIAWLDVLCSSYFQFTQDGKIYHVGPYAVSAQLNASQPDYPAYSWNLNVISHEMGHNIGSPHTHACAWGAGNQAIDDCWTFEGDCILFQDPIPNESLGTIMSYCHLTAQGIQPEKGFGPLPGDLIRGAIASASCLQDCASCRPAKIELSGNLVGTYSADTIVCNGCGSANGAMVNLVAWEFEINDSDFNEICLINGDCQTAETMGSLLNR